MWSPKHNLRAQWMRSMRGKLRRRIEVSHRPWRTSEVALLGTMPDAALAKRLGRTRVAVAAQRSNRGIPAWRKSAPPAKIDSSGPLACPLAWAVQLWGQP